MLEETVGFAGVVINAYRPAVGRLPGHQRGRAARDARAADGRDLRPARWLPVVLDERFARCGAYFIPEGAVDWSADGARYLPDLDSGSTPMRGVPATSSSSRAGTPPGTSWPWCRSASRSAAGARRTPSSTTSSRSGASAACALDHGQRAQEAARHRAALEELLAVSSKLACQDSIELVLEAVCSGVVRALGFAKVVIELIDPETGSLRPRAASAGRPATNRTGRCPPRPSNRCSTRRSRSAAATCSREDTARERAPPV